MSLRHAVAAGATAAALLPAVLMTAPTAFASGPASATPSPPTGATSAATATPTATATDRSAPPSPPSRSASPSPSPSLPNGELWCGDSMPDPPDSLGLAFHGLPERVPAGSGWHVVELTIANPSALSIPVVGWTVNVDTRNPIHDEARTLRRFSHVEVREDGAWVSEETVLGKGTFEGTSRLGPHRTARVTLRVRIDADVSEEGLGAARVDVIGSFFDPAVNCYREPYGQFDFTVLPPTRGAGANPPATTGPSPRPPAPRADDAATLARTGTPPDLPLLAAAGAATTIGAGAVFSARRRRAKGTTS